jgi:hypothetical protein
MVSRGLARNGEETLAELRVPMVVSIAGPDASTRPCRDRRLQDPDL